MYEEALKHIQECQDNNMQRITLHRQQCAAVVKHQNYKRVLRTFLQCQGS